MPLINNSVWLVHNHSIVFCVINAYYPQCFFQLDLQGHCVVLTSGPLGTVAKSVSGSRSESSSWMGGFFCIPCQVFIQRWG